MFDYLIVGAGFAGCVLAERLANQLGKRILLIDRRNHIGGNAFDRYDETGILIHQYGPHVFHTNSERVFSYLSQFTGWRYYQHRVLAYVDGQTVPFPINVDTINKLYGLKLNTEDLKMFLEKVRVPVAEIRSFRDAVISQVGIDLYQKLFEGYSRKQWGLDPSELDPSVAARVSVRFTRDCRYFTDRYQGVPSRGYSSMFLRMVANPKISILLNTSFQSIADEVRFDRLIYTGPVDEFFGYIHGRLPWRSLVFEFETYPMEWFQEVATVNYPNDYAFTRITEFKHLTGQKHSFTTIAREYPCLEGDPYYPVPTREAFEVYTKYEREMKKLKSVWFIGRLGTYTYLNMDQVVNAALNLFEQLARA